jgi:hypothetical protein
MAGLARKKAKESQDLGPKRRKQVFTHLVWQVGVVKWEGLKEARKISQKQDDWVVQKAA